MLNVFREDPEYAQHEAQYKAIARELLGEEESDQGEEEQGGPGTVGGLAGRGAACTASHSPGLNWSHVAT